MRLIICGSRNLTDFGFVDRSIIDVLAKHPIKITEVVSGCAKGADSLGEKWASMSGILIQRFPAEWAFHGKAAGPMRNQRMADYADACIAFPFGESRGTKDMIRRMKKARKPVWVYEYPEL